NCRRFLAGKMDRLIRHACCRRCREQAKAARRKGYDFFSWVKVADTLSDGSNSAGAFQAEPDFKVHWLWKHTQRVEDFNEVESRGSNFNLHLPRTRASTGGGQEAQRVQASGRRDLYSKILALRQHHSGVRPRTGPFASPRTYCVFFYVDQLRS